jgi:hypothetical protein
VRRRLGVWFAVVGALVVVTAAPASAASVASINTTATDFQSASLDDMAIQGSGASASVTGEVGYTDRADSGSLDQNSLSVNGENGLVFTVSSDRGVVIGDLAATPGGPTEVYLRYHGNGTLIDQEPVSLAGETVAFEHNFKPGTEYRITAADGPDTWTTVTYTNTVPYSSGALTVEHGFDDGFERTTARTFEDLAVGSAYDVSYVGPEHTADADTLFANISTTYTATVTAQANSGSGWIDVSSTSISSPQNVTLDISGSSATRYRTVVKANRTANQGSVTIHDEGVLFTAGSLSLSNPDPADGTTVTSYDGDISVDVSDADFGTAQGDTVTVEASNNEGKIGETTVTSDGTASLEYAPLGGANNITWTATDNYGNTATLSQDFVAPDRLEVRNVSDTSQLVDNVDVTIRFYQRDSNEVIEKTTSNGVISMTGLPASEEYLVTARADGYVTRKAIVSPLGGQQAIYLLNESRDTAEVVFEVSDPTGEFPPESTYLYVERPVNDSGNLTYQVITADTFGATASYAVDLEAGTRYRLRVVNGDGDERALGYYSATSPTTEFLRIQRIEPQANARADGAVYGAYNASTGALAVRFRGGEPDTTVVYEVRDSAGNVVISQTSATGEEFAHVYTLGAQPNETVSYTVDYEIQRPDAEDSTGEFTVGNLSGVGDRFDMDPQVLSIASWVAILATMGLTVIVDTSLAPATGAAMASVLTILGTVAIPAPMLGISGAIGVLAIIGGR